MKNKVINIIAIVLHIVALAILFTMKGYVSAHLGDKYGPVIWPYEPVNIVEAIKATPVYAVLLILFWGLSIFICVLSIISKSKKRVSIWHGLLPLIAIAITDMFILGSYDAVPNFFLLNGVMLAAIIVGFAKRSNFFVEE